MKDILLNVQFPTSPPTHDSRLGLLSSSDTDDQFPMPPERGTGEVRLHREVVGVLHAVPERAAALFHAYIEQRENTIRDVYTRRQWLVINTLLGGASFWTAVEAVSSTAIEHPEWDMEEVKTWEAWEKTDADQD